MLLDYLRLMRLPLILTAVADSLTGYFITRPSGDPRYEVPTLLALLSGLLYSAGMVFNDIEDLDRDKQIHSERPLPQGRVSRVRALWFGGVLLAMALLIANLISVRTVAVTGIMIIVIYLYDHFWKQNRGLGPIAMGLLRGLNFCLGYSVNLTWGHFDTEMLVYPGFLCLYVFFLTLISTLEEGDSRRETFMVLTAPMLLTVLALNIVLHGSLTALGLSIGIIGVLGYAAVTAWKAYSTETVRLMVLWSVMAIIPVDAMIAMGHGQYLLGIVLLGFLAMTAGFMKITRHHA